MNVSVNRIVERIEKLGGISDKDHCLSRFYGTPAHKRAGDLLMQWMEKSGMEVTKDSIGNIRGLLKSDKTAAKHFVIGSHYDTVINAGKYDGPLGILFGLEIAQRISENTIELPFHLNVVAFADEEGSRFNTAYLGSSVLAGNFEEVWLKRKDDTGCSLNEVIEKNGGKVEGVFNECIPKEDWLGYFEVHIEQGPVLCEKDLPLCLVSSIAAQTRVTIKWEGVCGHAGTYPMHLRSDALCAAAEFTLEVEKTGKAHTEKLVATIGKLNVEPNISNVISGIVTNSLDVRSPDNLLLAKVIKELKFKVESIAKKRGLNYHWEIMQTNPSVLCDAQLKTALSMSIKKTNIKMLIEIPSGAGHDAVMISKVAPVSMLFIRCKDGISHNPLEYVAPEDINEALNVSNNYIDEMIKISNTKNK